jgi:HSP20 family protein
MRQVENQIELKPEIQKPVFFVLDESQTVRDSIPLRLAARSHFWRPRTDVYETEDSVVVRVEVAGMREADFTIILDGRFLTVRGVRPDIQERRAYHQMEIPFGEFSSEVELHSPVVSQAVEASYSNGFLRIVLPKARPQRIEVDGL